MTSRDEVLAHFGVAAGDELGRGGEAVVYALDGERVLRVPHVWPSEAQARRRLELSRELERGARGLSFRVPSVLEEVHLGEARVTLERRLPGRSLMDAVRDARGAARADLIRAHLDASTEIGDIALSRPFFGDLLRSDAIRTRTQREYLEQRAAVSLRSAGSALAHVDPAELARALPEPAERRLVHLDAWAANMLCEDGVVTAVIDFGTVSILGDRRLDPLFSVAYVDPDLMPTHVPDDRRVAEEWLSERGLEALYPPARRWIAAFWSACSDEPELFSWCVAALAD